MKVQFIMVPYKTQQMWRNQHSKKIFLVKYANFSVNLKIIMIQTLDNGVGWVKRGGESIWEEMGEERLIRVYCVKKYLQLKDKVYSYSN